LPPLPVQNEIVRILDTFTNLTAELTARKKQYEYYRDKLLTFADGVEYKKLSEITLLTAGDRITKSMMRDDFEYPVMGGGVTPTGHYFDWSWKNCITISRAGAAGSIGWHPEKFWATDVCFVAAERNDVPSNIKFIYYAMKVQEEELRKHIYGGSMPKIDKKYLWNLSIPIPSLRVQNEVVCVLDRFDNLCNDLTQGLPAEIEARRKQYEYYRDKLLTFEQKGNT
ncbi:MAG: restriction endonuclease subunit S, partial [archaeon]|nr:restriction endonuclease subunit S [archaeon]